MPVIYPGADNMREFVDTFEWHFVPQLREMDFGIWYEWQWTGAKCGTSRHVEVQYEGATKMACSRCFEDPIHGGATGQYKEVHYLFSMRMKCPTCIYCGDKIIENLCNVRDCQGCTNIKYRAAENMMIRYEETRALQD